MVINSQLSPAAMASSVHYTLGWPVFFKPSSGGGSLEGAVVRTELQMIELLKATREHPYEQYMVEEFSPSRVRARSACSRSTGSSPPCRSSRWR
ncbi:hypothetical protein [Streptomyces sp. 7N604]|uniref:hypothetical protein n=1 Tax=Streptomyces sp. 7N604 TaxID=3457415 RepID=UPI003FCFA35B